MAAADYNPKLQRKASALPWHKVSILIRVLNQSEKKNVDKKSVWKLTINLESIDSGRAWKKFLSWVSWLKREMQMCFALATGYF